MKNEGQGYAEGAIFRADTEEMQEAVSIYFDYL